MLDLLAMARQKGSDDRLRAQTLVSIGIVHSTSALRICFVGDTPAKNRSTHTPKFSKFGYFIRVVFVVYSTISSPQVVPSRSPFKSGERYIALTVFLLCSLHFVWKMRLGYLFNTLFHCHMFCIHYENSFLLDITTVMLSRVFTACFHPVTFQGV